MPISDPADAQPGAGAHWRRTRRLALVLTGLWALITFAPPFFSRELAEPWLGVPLSVWIGAQLAPIAYVVLAWVCERRAERLDREQRARDG